MTDHYDKLEMHEVHCGQIERPHDERKLKCQNHLALLYKKTTLTPSVYFFMERNSFDLEDLCLCNSLHSNVLSTPKYSLIPVRLVVGC